MKLIYFIFPLALVSTASAEPKADPTIAVMATPTKTETMAIGDRVGFMRAFDVVLVNGGKEPVDLSKGCFRLYPSATVDTKYDGKYALDTIDEALASGKLAPEETIKGFVVFAADNAEIYDASVVRFFPSCST